MRPWNEVKIIDCKEPLVSLPSSIHCLNPHPYLSLGAPYGEGVDPWRLRIDVVRRLLIAQEYLSFDDSNLKFAVFDAWRPIPVQSFMIDYTIEQECRQRGINPELKENLSQLNDVKKLVNKYWAQPSFDQCTPPPHSTGAAVDLTLADVNGLPIDMGGPIDAIGAISEPNYYAKYGAQPSSSLYDTRRKLLLKVMSKAGFIQHPHEWWHYSFGDQLWAWTNCVSQAIYGAWAEDNKSMIA